MEVMDNIANAIKEAQEHGLTIEVMWSALKHLEQDDNKIRDALNYGLNEWIK